jgi:hypothetical protein
MITIAVNKDATTARIALPLHRLVTMVKNLIAARMNPRYSTNLAQP